MSWLFDAAADLLEWMIERLMPVFILLLILFLVLLGAAAIYGFVQDGKKPTFELKKGEWACTAAHDKSTTIYIKVGNVMVPSTTHSKVCDQWSAVK